MEKKVFLLYGPPASGKTTAVEAFLSLNNGFEYISVGEIVRKEITNNSKMGKLFKKFLNKDQPYPADLVGQIVFQKLTESKSSRFIIDGYPKYAAEAIHFLTSLKRFSHIEIEKIIFFDLNLVEAIKRSGSRFICTRCNLQQNETTTCRVCGGEVKKREDDGEVRISARFEDFKKSKSELLAILGSVYEKETFCEIDASGSSDSVAFLLSGVLNSRAG